MGIQLAYEIDDPESDGVIDQIEKQGEEAGPEEQLELPDPANAAKLDEQQEASDERANEPQ